MLRPKILKGSYVLLVILFVPVILTACSSNVPEEPYTVEYQKVYVPESGLEPSHRIGDKSDPEDIMRFAAGLVAAGQYADAAEQYMKLARGHYGPKPDSEAAYLLAMEGARMYFIAGKKASSPQEAVDMVKQIAGCTEFARNVSDISERVISKEESVLLYLGDISIGRKEQSYWTKVPYQLVSWVDSAQNQIGG
ncbi:hypothetical protein GF312_12555 [Candidatus Poribacteria bacterium]|nr:hypothetical protein [Candidatus Poribacteria bacterium]